MIHFVYQLCKHDDQFDKTYLLISDSDSTKQMQETRKLLVEKSES